MSPTKRFLVTGATGKVGQTFIRRLLADPAFDHFIVRALLHNRGLEPHDRLETVRGSISDQAVVEAALRDGSHLLGEPVDVACPHDHVVAGVVPDLEAVGVQLGDLLPRHVVPLVRGEVEPLGHEERGPEAVFPEDRAHDRMVRLHRVVERQDDQLFGDRFQGWSAQK